MFLWWQIRIILGKESIVLRQSHTVHPGNSLFFNTHGETVLKIKTSCQVKNQCRGIWLIKWDHYSKAVQSLQCVYCWLFVDNSKLHIIEFKRDSTGMWLLAALDNFLKKDVFWCSDVNLDFHVSVLTCAELIIHIIIINSSTHLEAQLARQQAKSHISAIWALTWFCTCVQILILLIWYYVLYVFVLLFIAF